MPRSYPCAPGQMPCACARPVTGSRCLRLSPRLIPAAGKRLELDNKPGRERHLGRPHARNPVDAVATQLAVVVYDKQDEVAVLGQAQRIGLDDARSLAAAFCAIVDLDHQAIGARITDGLKGYAAAP